MRSWIARRTRNAFAESLKKRGFDPDGRRLPGSGNKADMFGTASIAVSRVAMTTPYVELVKQTDIAVKYMENFQVKREGFKKGGKGQAQGTQLGDNGHKQNKRKDRPNREGQIANKYL